MKQLVDDGQTKEYQNQNSSNYIIEFLTLSFLCCFLGSEAARKSSGVNSSELDLRVNEEKDIRRKDYVDAYENPMWIALVFVSVLKTYDDNGNEIL